MHSEYIQQSAFSLSLLDVILTFSYVSEKYFWIKPIIDYNDLNKIIINIYRKFYKCTRIIKQNIDKSQIPNKIESA